MASKPTNPSKPAVGGRTPSQSGSSKPIHNRRASFKPSEKTYIIRTEEEAIVVMPGSGAVAMGKKNGSKVAKKRKEERRSYTLLNTVILFITALSLLSLQYCPPSSPSNAHSALSAFAPRTLFNPKSSVPAWERFVCAPTNAYRHHVLEPYIVPHVLKRVEKIQSNPIVKDHIVPAYRTVEKEVRPRYRVLASFVNKKYNRHIRPRIPVIQHNLKLRSKQLQKWIKPYSKKVEVLARGYYAKSMYILQPYLDQANKFIKPYLIRASIYQHMAVQQARRAQVAVADFYAHPHIGKAKQQVQNTYTHLKPIARQAGEHSYAQTVRSYRLARTKLFPQVLRGADYLVTKTEEIASVAYNRLYALYNQHLAPHIRPYVNRVDREIYTPYLKKRVAYLTPLISSILVAPSYGDIRGCLTSAAQSVRDNVNAAAAHVGHHAGEAAKVVQEAVPTGTVPVAEATEAAKEGVDALAKNAAKAFARVTQAVIPEDKPLQAAGESSEQKTVRLTEEKEEVKRIRSEIDHSLEVLDRRVEVTGENQLKAVRNKVNQIIEAQTKTTIPSVLQSKVSEIEKHAKRIVQAFGKFLEKLGYKMTDLTDFENKTIVKKVIAASPRAHTHLDQLSGEFGKELSGGLFVKNIVVQAGEVVEEAMAIIDASYAEDHEALSHKMTLFQGVTNKDWARHQAIEEKARAYRARYQAEVANALERVRTIEGEAKKEVNTLLKSYHAQLDEISSHALSTLGHKDGMSILPIATDAYEKVQNVAGDVIGKSKEQILQAMEAAGVVSAAAPEPESTGIVDKIKDQMSILPLPVASDVIDNIQDAAAGIIGKSREQIQQAFGQQDEQPVKAKGVVEKLKDQIPVLPTPLPFPPATDAASDLQAAAMGIIGKGKEQIQQAMENAGIVSPTPTPGVVEAAKSSASSLLSAGAVSVSSLAAQAVGATPSSPDIWPDHATSLVSAGHAQASSAVDGASSLLHDATESVKSAVHAATATSATTTATGKSVREGVEDQVEALLDGLAQFRHIVDAAASTAGAAVGEVTDKVKGRRDEL